MPVGCPALLVDDTVAAMERYGAHVVRQWAPRVVAVTGTVGKTGTKELVADVLATRFTVFRTPGNFSGRFGLAVALGGLRPEHQVAVVEMATGHFGEIDAMCAIAPPEVAVVTAVGAAHLLALGDVEGVAREKSTLVGPPPDDGLAVLNADDPRVRRHGRAVPGPGRHVRRLNRCRLPCRRRGGLGVRHHVHLPPRARVARPSTVPLLGAHSASAALGRARRGRPLRHRRTRTPWPRSGGPHAVPGRLRPLPGRAGSLLLDDTYNAAPRSVLAGLDTLAALPGTPRIAVLGGMAELGPASEELHRGSAAGRPRWWTCW